MGLAGSALGSPGLELGLFPKPLWLARPAPLPACPLTAPAGGGRGKEKEGQVELGPSGVQEQLGRGWGEGTGDEGLAQPREGWVAFLLPRPFSRGCLPGGGRAWGWGFAQALTPPPQCPMWGLVGGWAQPLLFSW